VARRRDATMEDVANHAGVALSSVSRVLNDHPDVSDRMKQRVMGAIADVGYEPNLLASSLRRGSTKTIGFLASDISNPLFAEIALGAERRLDEAEYTMVLTNSEGSGERDEEMIRLLRWRRTDGLILSVSDERRAGTLVELARLDVPVVLIDRDVKGLDDASVVTSDHARGMRSAVDHLIELGHTDIALISGPRQLRPARERLRVFRRAFRDQQLEPPEHLLRIGSFSAQSGEQATLDLLASDRPPTAMIAGGNLLLTGVLRALRRRKLTVGRDIALVSCDEVPLTELHSPPITVIARDAVHMGDLAAELLLERLVGDAEPRRAVVPTSLIVRDSTKKARRR